MSVACSAILLFAQLMGFIITPTHRYFPPADSPILPMTTAGPILPMATAVASLQAHPQNNQSSASASTSTSSEGSNGESSPTNQEQRFTTSPATIAPATIAMRTIIPTLGNGGIAPHFPMFYHHPFLPPPYQVASQVGEKVEKAE